MQEWRVAVLITCHNRRDKTLACLEALFKNVIHARAALHVYLVDDGSTDGTAEAIRNAYPQVRILRGGGDLFWNGGMRLAFSEALAVGYDYYLWLNDDTLLDPWALDNLLNTHCHLSARGAPDSIVVGSTRDPDSGIATYGGLVRKSRWRPLKFELVEPGGEPRECDTMNGNCVLVPRAVAEKVGNLNGAFTHGMGDHDYGLRARKTGCSVWVAPGYVGYCSRNSTHGSWTDTSLPFRERLRKVGTPKGLPVKEWKTFVRRHAGPLWFVYWIQPYARLIVSSLLKGLLKRIGKGHVGSLITDLSKTLRREPIKHLLRTAEETRPKVAIVQRTLPHYRRPFFEMLRKRLDELGVELVLVYGQPSSGEVAKKDAVELSWGYKVNNRTFRFRSREVCWQPCLGLLKDADLIIVEQASKLLVNYVLFAQQLLGLKKLAFWGHGKNFQAHEGNHVSEAVKRFITRRMHWWFAYNALSTRVVKDLGFPEERITSVQNAIDTRRLVEARSKISPEAVQKLTGELGLKGENVCIYAGGMYAEKRLGFLLEACQIMRKKVPDFEMIFIGSGAEKSLVEEAARQHNWIRYVGPKFDEEKVIHFALAKLFLMPGLVGLAVVDAFALEVPLVTTAVPYHSPEIEYLEDGANGVLVQDTDDPSAYAAAVVRLLENEGLRSKLIAGCRASTHRYTLEEMVERFAAGIMRALK